MAKEITVNDNEEFEDLIKSEDINISNALIDTILLNLKGRKRHIHALSVVVIEDSSIYDITVDRNDFLSTLKSHLHIFEVHELYEKCSEIVNAVKFLEENIKK